MLGNHGRSITRTIFTPFARLLAQLGVTPNMVTVAGTVISVVVAVSMLPFGLLWQGAIVLGIVLFCDSVDGTLARMTTGGTPFGAFLDSTLDRISDGAVFASLTAYAVFQMEPSLVRTLAIILGLAGVVLSATVPYARARAESVGVEAKLGIAERTDRLIVALVGAFLMDLGLSPWFFVAGLAWVALGSLITVIQRIWFTSRALNAPESP
ncbi:CDP-alcohol phosphatidyltransferase family protein [Schaalia sp. ZJ405]|uniref:phosphatidylinositol phosphate synthase n=1 Tax=unclassified Schaalia TaxID=2691889 RepID=UPI0013EDE496|nr:MULTISPECIES: CDP-alcohol phosphatidyltransferase family protein [unclassified Schaalia]QPK82253.1 CDP-alcohol phosphatidyltransferase family protein [Schaalia sp. ZJ405]